jgi:hypothetical protein
MSVGGRSSETYSLPIDMDNCISLRDVRSGISLGKMMEECLKRPWKECMLLYILYSLHAATASVKLT